MLLPSMCLFYSSHRIIFPFIEKGLIYGRRSTKEILLFEDELPADQHPPLAIFLFLFKTLLTLLFSTAPHPPGDLKCKLSCFMAFPRAVYELELCQLHSQVLFVPLLSCFWCLITVFSPVLRGRSHSWAGVIAQRIKQLPP